MMTKPSITELDRNVDSRYTLVAMAAKRARMIGLERSAAEDAEGYALGNLDKPVTQAVNEIAGGIVGYVRSEAIDKAREYEEEKINAISRFEKETQQELPDENEDSADTDADDVAEEANLIDTALRLALDKEDEDDN